MVVLGDKLGDLKNLTVEFECCVVLPEGVDVSKIPLNKYTVDQNFHGGHIITRKPESYTGYVKTMLAELVENPGEIQTIRSFGKHQSERTTIHHVAVDLNVKVSVKKSNQVWIVEIIKDGEVKQPYWTKKLVLGKRVKFDFGKDVKFSNFRAQVYRWAKNNNKVVVVSYSEGSEACLILTKQERTESTQKRFNTFLDTIPQGGSSMVPQEFSSTSDGYIRVMLSNHPSSFSFTRGTINHLSPAPHIDSNGNFVMNGHNFGPKPDTFIRLKLRNTDYTLEDIKV